MLGNKLKFLREKEGLSQVELGKKLGIGNATLSQYEKGVRTPDNDTLVKFADFYNVSVDYLLGRDGRDIVSFAEKMKTVLDIDKIVDDAFQQYYIDNEVQQIAQEIHDDQDLRILFSASRNLKKEDIKFVVDMVERLKKG